MEQDTLLIEEGPNPIDDLPPEEVVTTIVFEQRNEVSGNDE